MAAEKPEVLIYFGCTRDINAIQNSSAMFSRVADTWDIDIHGIPGASKWNPIRRPENRKCQIEIRQGTQLALKRLMIVIPYL